MIDNEVINENDLSMEQAQSEDCKNVELTSAEIETGKEKLITEQTVTTNAVKSVGRSMQFLLLVIFVTLNQSRVIYTLLKVIGAVDDFSALNGYSIAGYLTGALLPVLGLWLCFSACAGRNAIPKRTGLMLLNIYLIIYALSMIITFSSWIKDYTSGFFLTSSGQAVYKHGGNLYAISDFIYYTFRFLIVVIFIMYVVYLIQLRNIVGRLINALKYGDLSKKIGRLPIIFCYIAVVGSCIDLLLDITSYGLYMGALMILETAVIILPWIFKGIVLTKLRREIPCKLEPHDGQMIKEIKQ